MEHKAELLLVEDDPNLGNLLEQYLQAKGYGVVRRTDGQQGLNAFKEGDYDLLILDVMMPVKDGFALAREVRALDAGVPIIFLTAKSMKQDAIHGFQAGADDYLTKPFSMEELLLRIAAVLRRSRAGTPTAEGPVVHRAGGITFDERKQMLRNGDQERRLTTKESELLRLLFLHANDLLPRSEALKQIWGDDSYFNGRSMDVYIARLRKYLKDEPAVEIINIHGKGFRLVVREAQ
ncbi:MAG: response regulator transcription factor [Flavobacteriales bacterium]|nr:response regulator transcription factor [Flavobacteriales bacterium]